MPKRPHENHFDYKTRVIDPISKSFCAAKWLNATIWLGNGQTASCHHPPAHQIHVADLVDNPSGIHNTPHKKKMRRMMLEGERPNECEYCWKIEDMGEDAVSDRVYKTLIFSDDDIASVAKADPQDNVTLKTLEVSFDRTCQFACSYCNPTFSTTWAKDIKVSGPYQNILSDTRNHFTHEHASAQPFAVGVENPYVTAFWKWWPELSQTLEEIRITGGEPLMSKDVWKMFQWFEKNPQSTMRFGINSNLGAKPEFIDKLIEKSHHVRDLQIYTSNEAFGAQAEYIRDGLDYGVWRDNMRRLVTQGNVRALHIMMTINGLCLSSIVPFLDDVMAMKREFGHQYPMVSMNILRFPTFQSPLVLPFAKRQDAADRLGRWLAGVLERDERDEKSGAALLSDFEINHTRRLIDYLTNVNEPHADSAPQDKLEHDFKVFYRQYDARRGKNLLDTFPDLEMWVNSIKEIGTKDESIDEWFDAIMKDGDGQA